MARSCYSTVFEQPADQVWEVIRDFGNYTVWVEGAGASHIEEGKSGDTVGAIRNATLDDRNIRQRLLAHSDLDRSFSYEYCDPVPFPVPNYQATVRVTPVVDGNRALIEWWATFDCMAAEYDHWTAFYASSFESWLESLRKHVAR